MQDALPKFRVIVAAALVAGAAAGQTLLWTLPGPPNPTWSQFGSSIAGGGDVNGDGFPDFVVGAPLADTVSIYSGFDGTVLHTETGSGHFGASVAIVGDANGDGLADVLIGAPTAGPGGAVRGLLGGTFTGATTFGPPVPGIGYSDFGYGAHVAAAGDINGDGLADAIVLRPGGCRTTVWDYNCSVIVQGFSYAGIANVYAGGTGAVLHQILGSSGEPFPRLAAGVGDVNSDGVPDFALLGTGTTSWSDYSCTPPTVCVGYPFRLTVRSGATGAELWSYTTTPMNKPCLAAVGDLNGDQRSEILLRGTVGAWGAFQIVTMIFSGANGAVILSYSESLSPTLPNLPVSCAGVGDVDGDGVPDYAIGDPVYLMERVRVFSGASHTLIYILNGATDSGFGTSIAGLGDLNGDGRGDFAVGCVPQTGSVLPVVKVFSGATLPGASIITLGGGCGAGGGVPVLSLSSPMIGTPVTLALAGGPYPAAGMLVASAVPAGPNIVPGGPGNMDPCPVFVDFGTVIGLTSFTTGPAGDWNLVVPLPNSPAIAGNVVALTAGLWPNAGGFAASNTLVASPGY